MKLIIPSIEYKDSFIEAVKEFQNDTNPFSLMSERYKKLSVSELESNFLTHVEKVKSKASGKNIPESFVPETEYWLIDDDKFIGRLSIRHNLTKSLEEIGGHIGYDIRPSQREKGYGTEILKLALPKARDLGLDKVLLTCLETNEASKKIIEKNGGIYKDYFINDKGNKTLHYWIDINTNLNF